MVSVYAPTTLVISIDDATLNRINAVDGSAIISGGCGSAPSRAYPYQRTRVRLLADGLDASPLVQFETDDATIATMGTGQLWDVAQGVAAGEAEVRLVGRPSGPTADLAVVDSAVTVTSFVARVVTAVSWQPAPASSYAFAAQVSAGLLLRHQLRTEGASGFLYATVTCSDGAAYDVAPYAEGAEELKVATSNSYVSLVAPSGGQTHWQVGVAVGAVASTVEDVYVNWTVCSSVAASSFVPLLLDLPNPTGATLSFSQSRLTAPDDGARLAPLSLPTSSGLSLVVAFDDGTQRDFTSDPRVTYSVGGGFEACVSVDGGSNSASVLNSARAAGCSEVFIVATVQLGSFTLAANTTRPLVYLDRIALRFTGYPANNAAVSITTLQAVGCSAGSFERASAAVDAFLTDAPTSALDVTVASVFVSDDESMVAPTGSTMRGVAAGIATITASFGGEVSSAALTVSATASSASSLAWSVPLSGDTLRAVTGSTRTTTLSVSFAAADGTLTYSDLGGSTFTNWLDLRTMVTFSSDSSSAVSVSGDGTVQLLDNSHTEVGLTAAMACASSVLSTVALKANLDAAELDVDLGELSGYQFQQVLPPLPTSTAYRPRTPDYTTTSFATAHH